MERLDEERIDVLRGWGERLWIDSREEVRAAGRAILILIAEIDQLRVELWNERSRATAPPPEPDAPAADERTLQATLRSRLSSLVNR